MRLKIINSKTDNVPIFPVVTDTAGCWAPVCPSVSPKGSPCLPDFFLGGGDGGGGV